MKTTFISALYTGQALLSTYGLYHSYVSITNLMQYEEKSKKAAEWSNTAAHQLRKTRTTQATGAGAIITSLTAAVVLLIRPSLTATTIALIHVGISCVALAAATHIGNFWDGKARVPFVGGYNEGMRRTQALKNMLQVLAGTWIFTGIVRFALE